jgi:HIV Tat-specific factor 1
MEDLETGEAKIKIYTDDKGVPKGDALISFFKEESVPLSIELLDEAELRPGKANTKMTIQKAVFKEKDNNNVEKKKTLAGKQKAKKKMQQMHRKLDWIEEQGGKKTEKFAKIVILKHMYTLEELDQDPTLLLELKEDVREECEKLGEVTNVILYDVSNHGIHIGINSIYITRLVVEITRWRHFSSL